MVTRSEVVNAFTDLFDKPDYLEVGVNAGETFMAIRALKKVAVDPHFRFDTLTAHIEQPGTEFHEVPSDVYFSNLVDPKRRFNVIYLDGLHTFDQTLRDFTNAIHHLSQDGVIVIDDVLPTSYAASLPNQGDAFLVKQQTHDEDNSWMGDTFKLVYFIRSFFPIYNLGVTSDNHGQAIVWRSDKSYLTKYSQSIKDISNLQFLDILKGADIFERSTLDEIVHMYKTSHIK